MVNNIILSVAFVFGIVASILAQSNPVFSTFNGEVIYFEEDWPSKYGSHVHSANVLKNVSWTTLNIPKVSTSKPFNGYNFGTRFGIIFNSTMQIESDGRYEFSLSSDDGSILWIGDEEIINNDSIHRMKNITDTINLKAGNFPVRIWYFQGALGEQGLQFNARYISPILEEKIEINSELLFTANSSKLDQQSEKYLIEQISKLKTGDIKKIEIHGYTCTDGAESVNMKLSLQRAKSVENIIIKNFSYLALETKAHGESMPKYDNSNPALKPKNRRIELVIHYKN